VDFGCFVALEGVKGRCEGLVHISEMRREGRVMNPREVVTRNQQVKVKVKTVAGKRISLSMKEVNQQTGEDLCPQPSALKSNSSVKSSKLQAKNDEFKFNPLHPADEEIEQRKRKYLDDDDGIFSLFLCFFLFHSFFLSFSFLSFSLSLSLFLSFSLFFSSYSHEFFRTPKTSQTNDNS
jgi:predicted RNA-binding protein with RPS1 domain